MSASDELLARLYASGLTIQEIASELNRSSESVRRAMVVAGIERRPTGQPAGKHLPKGGRIVDEDGYVLVLSPGHPHARSSGYIFEHRLVMEWELGRALNIEEVVAHRNGIKADNRIENLVLHADNAAHKRASLQGNSRALGDIGNPRRRVRRKRSPQQLLFELASLAAKLDRPIRRSDLHPPYPSYRSVARAFGTWQSGVSLALGTS